MLINLDNTRIPQNWNVIIDYNPTASAAPAAEPFVNFKKASSIESRVKRGIIKQTSGAMENQHCSFRVDSRCRPELQLTNKI
jgi:hypothetical protein